MDGRSPQSKATHTWASGMLENAEIDSDLQTVIKFRSFANETLNCEKLPQPLLCTAKIFSVLDGHGIVPVYVQMKLCQHSFKMGTERASIMDASESI